MQKQGLLFEATNGRSRFLVTAGQSVLIGRRPPCEPQNVRVLHSIISRKHARIVGDDHGFTIEDAESTGGTYLNDERIQGPVPISPGDCVKLTSSDVYIARPFTGESLWDILCRGPLEFVTGYRMARDVLRALLPLHAADLAHGSLTPHEILQESNGSFPLMIQGWSVIDDSGAVNCNPTYLAPETFQEARVEPATDMYALGLILFEAFSGRRPYSTETPLINQMSKLHGSAPSWDPSWSNALRDWLLGMMQLFPRNRPLAQRALEQLYELRPELRNG